MMKTTNKAPPTELSLPRQSRNTHVHICKAPPPPKCVQQSSSIRATPDTSRPTYSLCTNKQLPSGQQHRLACWMHHLAA
jgi:hypothetical protein